MNLARALGIRDIPTGRRLCNLLLLDRKSRFFHLHMKGRPLRNQMPKGEI
jgi:hypothetical protein